MREWKPGDLVTVVTFNRGLSVRQPRKGSKREDATVSWAGEIVGPSLLGPGWWNVRRIGPKGGRRGSFAVPENEIERDDGRSG